MVEVPRSFLSSLSCLSSQSVENVVLFFLLDACRVASAYCRLFACCSRQYLYVIELMSSRDELIWQLVHIRLILSFQLIFLREDTSISLCLFEVSWLFTHQLRFLVDLSISTRELQSRTVTTPFISLQSGLFSHPDIVQPACKYSLQANFLRFLQNSWLINLSRLSF